MSCVLSTSHFCTYMAPKDTHKRYLSDEHTGSPPPTKKVKGTVRRSHRVGKGSGGAVDQLQKIGNVITTVQSKKTRDIFKDAGEELNPMAPESPTKRVKKVQTLWGCCDMLTLVPTFRRRRRPSSFQTMNQSAMYFFLLICVLTHSVSTGQ